MMNAGIRGDDETIKALLECGAVPTPAAGEFSMSPLKWAASMGNAERVRMLIQAGADLNEEDKDGHTPLAGAVMHGSIDAARALLEAGANPNAKGIGITPMAFAAMQGNTEMVRLLTQHGARTTPIDTADEEQAISVEILPGVKENREMMSIIRAASGVDLHEAAKSGNFDRVIALLDEGRDINRKRENGRTALFEAAEQAHFEIVSLLLERGADPNITDMIDSAPLHSAIQHGHIEMAKLLLARGADPDLVSEQGFTPLLTAALAKSDHRTEAINLLIHAVARVGLQEAAAMGDVETLRNLVQMGRDPGEPNSGGLTALMAAAAAGRLDSLSMLAERCRDLDARDRMGNTALT